MSIDAIQFSVYFSLLFFSYSFLFRFYIFFFGNEINSLSLFIFPIKMNKKKSICNRSAQQPIESILASTKTENEQQREKNGMTLNFIYYFPISILDGCSLPGIHLQAYIKWKLEKKKKNFMFEPNQLMFSIRN